MEITKSFAFVMLAAVIHASCDKGEIPISPREPGPEITAQVSIGSDYGQQVFYNLKDNQVVNQVHKTSWDVGFESGENGWRIFLNSSRGGAAAVLENTAFNEVTSTDNLIWKYDAPSGHPDSTAVGDYRLLNATIVIDRGFNPGGQHTGYQKIKVLEVNESQYEIMSSSLSGEQAETRIIPKDPALNLNTFSFTTQTVVPVEPPRETWDLLFTQYLHLFYNPLMPYLVTGVLLNPHDVEAVRITDRAFEDITIDDAPNFTFENRRDVIGYDWKTYDFETASFITHANMVFLIRDGEGRYFKLRFTDFYTDTGQRGAPRFDMQEL